MSNPETYISLYNAQGFTQLFSVGLLLDMFSRSQKDRTVHGKGKMVFVELYLFGA